MQHKAIAGGFHESTLDQIIRQGGRRAARLDRRNRMPRAIGWLIGLGLSLGLWAGIISGVAEMLPG